VRSKAVALLCVVAGLPFIVGCPIPLRPVQQVKLLDAHNDGDTVTGNQGDILLIVLAANPTTGYAWVQLDPWTPGEGQPIVAYDQEWYVPLDGGGLTGQGGVEVLQFGFGFAGTAPLTLELRKGGAPASDPPADTFSVAVQSMG
jgi:predicted secreted protein